MGACTATVHEHNSLFDDVKIMIRPLRARAGEHMVQTLALLIISVLISMMENITSFGQQNNDGYTVANNIGKALVSRYLTLCGIPGWGAKASRNVGMHWTFIMH